MSYAFTWESEDYYMHINGVVTTNDMNNILCEIWRNPKSDSLKVSNLNAKFKEE